MDFPQASFFDNDFFGVAITYKGTSIKALFRSGAPVVDPYGRVDVNANPSVLVRASDVASPVQGDAIVYSGVTYKVGMVHPEFQGLFKLEIIKQ